jgi:tRNA (guanine37-N1)-methyltransferase
VATGPAGRGDNAGVRLDIFTLFPEAFEWFEEQRPVRNALARGSELNLFNYRDTTPLGAGQVDDAPYGGGAGMVLRVDVVDAALEAAYPEDPRARVVVLSPSGRLFDDELARELALEPHVALLSGRYEGFDQRVHDQLADDDVSIGRYVLAGGELPAMVVADAVIRKLPGALGHENSAVEESFSEALGGGPEYPQYTRPPVYKGWGVPEVLLSGDHERVREWRLARSRERAEERGGSG